LEDDVIHLALGDPASSQGRRSEAAAQHGDPHREAFAAVGTLRSRRHDNDDEADAAVPVGLASAPSEEDRPGIVARRPHVDKDRIILDLAMTHSKRRGKARVEEIGGSRVDR
jgi:hypothetical protein